MPPYSFKLCVFGCAFFLSLPVIPILHSADALKIDIILNNIWEQRKQVHQDALISQMDLEKTDGLYYVQIETAPLLDMAAETQNIAYLDSLAELYLIPYDYLTLQSQRIYFYWPGFPRESVHPLETPARMWLGPAKNVDGIMIGSESVLHSSQFLYAAARMCHAILDIPAASRTANMNTFLAQYPSVILTDHYERWVFSMYGIFQVRGWGGPVGLHNHQAFLEKKRDLDFPSSPLYLNSVTDTDLWIAAGVVEMLAAHEKDSSAVPLASAKKQAFLDYVSIATTLIQQRMTTSALTNFSGASATGLNFDRGIWDDYHTHAYSGYTGATSPLGQPEQPGSNVGWDISHARRFVDVFGTLYRNRNVTGQTFPGMTTMQQLANQFVYGVFNKDLTRPKVSNYMDGTNGWYRVGYTPGFPGHGPYGLSSALLTGGYGHWAEFSSDMALLRDSLWDMIASVSTKDTSGHFRDCALFMETEAYSNGNGRYLKFDGTTYLSPGVSPDYASENGAITLWFKSDDSTVQDLINIQENSYNDFLLVRKLGNNRIHVLIEDDNVAKVSVSTANAIQVGQWNHLAITQDGTGVKSYLNGVLENTTGTNSDFWTGHLNIKSMRIGSSTWNYNFKGGMDGITFYSTGLSQEDVLAEYQVPVSSAGTTIAHWTFSSAEEQYVAFTADTVRDGKVDAAATFDGTTQYVRPVSGQEFATTQGTISLWFKPDGSADGDLMNIRENGYYDFLLVRKKADGRIFFLIEDENVVKVTQTTTNSVQTGGWNHLVITQDGTGVKIYLNGTLASTTGVNSGYWTQHLNITSILIGRSSWNYYQGAIDEVQICDDAWTQQDVLRELRRADMNSRWEFDEIQDMEVVDFVKDIYGTDFNVANSKTLLQFLPTFLK